MNSLLKFQGIKVTASGAGTEHSHGHLSVGMDDLAGGLRGPCSRHGVGVPEAHRRGGQ